MEFKWAEDLLQKKINEKMVEHLMEVNKSNPVVEKIMDYKAIERNLIESLSVYECKYGFTPNKIVMGYDVYQYFQTQFYCEYVKEKDEYLGYKTTCAFWGVPIEVDYKNPNRLEIGHMIKFS
jgi:hypothetical protein